MYTENNNGGLIKNIILKLLFIALFIFLLLWLYPMPNTKPFYDAIFNDNINNMKEVAEDYYTVQRLPKQIGEIDKLTLKQMLDKKLLLPFVDKNGEYCDYEKSYVQVTKLENDEYELKVNLSCKDQTDYIIVYLGCHDLCVDGKCETVVSTIEYKFTREVFKGRKLITTDLYKYEYTKSDKTAYTVDKLVTYYKGRKKASDDLYKYEYTKPEPVPYNETVTSYIGKKQLTPDVYQYEYTKPEQVPYNETVTYYIGRRQLTTDTYQYEYTRTTTTASAPTCTTVYNQSSCPSGKTCTANTRTITVNDGYTYGSWTTTSSFTSSSHVTPTSTDTYRVVSDGYTTTTTTSTCSGCPTTSILYKYSVQTRTKTPKTREQTITTYTYQNCTSNPPTTTTETTWSTQTSLSGWTRTGNSKLVSSATYDTTGWVTSLPAGYQQINQKTETVVKYRTENKTQWSTQTSLSGWTATGNKKLVSSATYDTTGWVTSLPAGYQQIDKKTETVVKYKTENKTQWSTEDLTKQGWTKTGKSELVSKGSYIETGWVTSLPAGYEQIDKKTETEKEVKYKTTTKKEWSTEDLTKQGWTKTGNKIKIGQTTKYEYTQWVTKLPAGYEQTDKKIEEKWSTEKKLDGWTLTKETRIKEDK